MMNIFVGFEAENSAFAHYVIDLVSTTMAPPFASDIFTLPVFDNEEQLGRELELAARAADILIFVISRNAIRNSRILAEKALQFSKTARTITRSRVLILTDDLGLAREFFGTEVQVAAVQAEDFAFQLHSAMRPVSLSFTRTLPIAPEWTVHRPIITVPRLQIVLLFTLSIGLLYGTSLAVLSLLAKPFPVEILLAGNWVIAFSLSAALAMIFYIRLIFSRSSSLLHQRQALYAAKYVSVTSIRSPALGLIAIILVLASATAIRANIVGQTLAPITSEAKSIFYVTDRAAIDNPNFGVRFSSDPSAGETISYGQAMTLIPWQSERRKQLVVLGRRSSSERRIKHQLLTREEFFFEVNRSVASSDSRSAFVFTHGFNVPFNDGLTATGQLARDLKFDGASILFSWPAGEQVTGYVADLKRIGWSARHFRALLNSMVNDVRPNRLHLVAHSMGSRLLALTVEHVARRDETIPNKPFENIILAAADLDSETFNQSLPDLRRLGSRITMYVCNCDLALWTSQRVDRERLDSVGTLTKAYEGVDVINADTADLERLLSPRTGIFGALNHSYLLASELILHDLDRIINYNVGPERRVGIRKDGCCWVFQHR